MFSSITKQNNNRLHSTAKLTLIEASLNKDEGYVWQNLIDKRKRIKAKFKFAIFLEQHIKRTFLKGDTTNWSYQLHKIRHVVNDTMPCYCKDNLPERYNEALLRNIQS